MKIHISHHFSKLKGLALNKRVSLVFILLLIISAAVTGIVRSKVVNAAGQPAECVLTASPTTVQVGETVVIGWLFGYTTSHATSSAAVNSAGANSRDAGSTPPIQLNTVGPWTVTANAKGTDGVTRIGCASVTVNVVPVVTQQNNTCSINAYIQNGAWRVSWTTNTNNWTWKGQLYTGSPSSRTGDMPFPGVDGLELNGGRPIDPPSGTYTTYTYLAYNPDNRSQFIACNGGADRRNETPPDPSGPPGVPQPPGTVDRCNVGYTQAAAGYTLVWRSNVSSQHASYKALIYRAPQTEAGTTYGLGLNDSRVIVPPAGSSTYVVVIYNPVNMALLTSCSVMVINTSTPPSSERFVDNPPGGKVGNRDCERGTTNRFLHARNYWLTSGGGRGPVTIPAGNDGLGLEVNAIGEVCEGYNYVNVLPNGGVSNQTIKNDAIYVTAAGVSASPAIPGLNMSSIVGKSLTIDRTAQYAAVPGLTFTGIANFPFSVSGLRNISPGINYTITIDTTVAMTALANGQLVCASPAMKPTTSIQGPGCTQFPQQFKIIINQGTVPVCTPGDPECTPNPGFQCQVLEPVLKQPGEVASTTIYRGKTNARLKWTTTGNATGIKAYADDGTELSNAIGTGVTVAPPQTKTYFLARSPTADAADRYCTITVYVEIPANRPYLKIDGSDVYSGASFGPDCTPTDEAKDAKIITNGYFNDRDTWGYSGTQYGAFASGSIGGANFSNNVFLGNNGYVRSNLLDLLFANNKSGDGNGEAGKYYGNSGNGLTCVRLEKVKQAASSNPTNNLDNTLASGVGTFGYDRTATIGTTTVSGQKTIVIDGNLTITGNINYASPYQLGNIPYLRIIANNISIASGVTRIDANLVAHPTDNGRADGVLDTCGTGAWNTPYVIGSCARNSSLKFNGSITARRILWKGTWGTVGISDSTVDQTCLYGGGGDSVSRCAAEHVIFNPEAYLAGFAQPNTVLFGTPVSTLELPPIY